MSEQEFPTLEDWWASGNEDYVELESIVRAITKEKDAEIEKLEKQHTECATIVTRQMKEIDQINAKVAMLREALEFECGDRCNAEYNPCNARATLQSTEKGVTQWVNGVKADALEEAIKKLEKYRYENSDEFFVETAIEILRGEYE